MQPTSVPLACEPTALSPSTALCTSGSLGRPGCRGAGVSSLAPPLQAYAWEALFAARVERERQSELAALAVRKYLDALCVYFWWVLQGRTSSDLA